jgi:hypothetical protein
MRIGGNKNIKKLNDNKKLWDSHLTNDDKQGRQNKQDTPKKVIPMQWYRKPHGGVHVEGEE